MQKINLSGRLGRDARVSETESGTKVLSFVVASTFRSRGVEKTHWFDVSSFNYERYKNMVPYLKKGTAVIVGGDLDADIEEGRDGVYRCRRNILADYIDFASSGTSGSTANTQTTVTTGATRKSPAAVVEEGYDEEPVVTTKPSKKVVKKVEPVVEAEEPTDDTEAGDDLPF